jgi:predicted RNA methylase
MINTTVTGFKALRFLNDPALHPLAASHGRIDDRALSHVPPDSRTHQVLAALAARSAIPMKEVCESFEFFERVRRRLRAPHVADLCAGHGLTGILFALFERVVERVTLIDIVEPDSFAVILDALTPLAPWLPQKVRYVHARIQHATQHLDPQTSIVAIHACGQRSDRCIDAALALKGAVALMPCCYTHTAGGAPIGVRDTLGIEVAADIHRTYRLHGAGYTVRWSTIPPVITPMNRILIADLSAT